jgi:hypothetical protein
VARHPTRNTQPEADPLPQSGILIDATPEKYALEKNIKAVQLKNQLEATNRPTAEKLAEQNIMRASDKPKDLEKAMATDAVKSALENRPDKEELAEGILKTPHEAKKAELEQSIAKDTLEKKLDTSRRPTVADVEAQGILKDPVRAKSDSLR